MGALISVVLAVAATPSMVNAAPEPPRHAVTVQLCGGLSAPLPAIGWLGAQGRYAARLGDKGSAGLLGGASVGVGMLSPELQGLSATTSSPAGASTGSGNC